MLGMLGGGVGENPAKGGVFKGVLWLKMGEKPGLEFVLCERNRGLPFSVVRYGGVNGGLI